MTILPAGAIGSMAVEGGATTLAEEGATHCLLCDKERIAALWEKGKSFLITLRLNRLFSNF